MTQPQNPELTRRQFLKLSAAAATSFAALPLLSPLVASASTSAASGAPLPIRPLGKTGAQVTILGLGGEGVLRTWGRTDEAVAVIRRAIERGITYCDSAPAYNGSLDYYGEALGSDRKRVFLASKTHDRTRDGSWQILHKSLSRLRTDHLDLWQLHDLRTVEELDQIFGKEGAIEAMEQARREGLVRFVGVTGHTDPLVLVEALRRYPFDTVLMSLNVADRHRLSFIKQLLPVATQQHLGIIGMKVFAKGQLLRPNTGFTTEPLLRYVLSLPVSLTIVGLETPAQVDEAADIVQRFQPLSPEEMTRLETLAKPHAAEANWFKRP